MRCPHTWCVTGDYFSFRYISNSNFCRTQPCFGHVSETDLQEWNIHFFKGHHILSHLLVSLFPTRLGLRKSDLKPFFSIQVNFGLFRIQSALLHKQQHTPLPPWKFAAEWIQHFSPGSNWDQLVHKPILSAVISEWRHLELVGQWQVLSDLSELWERVFQGQLIRAPEDLKYYITNCLILNVRSFSGS